MAAAPGLLLWLLLLLGHLWRLPGADVCRRFSKLKVCGNDDCSALMCRGEALEDFTGPDCRFVSFKKGDSVYVYFKLAEGLAEGSPEVWAGTIGQTFGYFPKDLIRVVHVYTKEELQLPTEERDFICPEDGRDDFDNYNIEEILGHLELYSSESGNSEKAVAKPSQNAEKPREISEDNDSEPNLEESESLFSEDAKDLEERFEVQKNHLHIKNQIENAHGKHPSFEPFEEILPDKLKVSESENNKTSNSFQVSDEQEEIDAYKLLKKEMTLDLKTKFGSTTDALVSHNETTRLVTSLDENLDAEYYPSGKEEEKEDKENFDELPLLTFKDGEDKKIPVKLRVEKYSTDEEQNSDEETKLELTQAPGIKIDDKNILTTLGDTIFSVVPGGEEKAYIMDLESSNIEEKKDDDILVLDSKWREAEAAADYIDPKKAKDGLLIEEVPKANDDKDLEMNTKLHVKEKGREVLDSSRGLEQDETELEDEVQKRVYVHGSTQNADFNSLLAAETGKTVKPAFDYKENYLKRATTRISKQMFHEENPGEQILEGGSKSESAPKTVGTQMDKAKMKQKSMDIASLLEDNQHNAFKDSVEDVDVLVSRSEPHTVSVDHQGKEFKENLVLKTQNQPRFSSPDDTDLLSKQEDKVSLLERYFSWQQERNVAVVVSKQMNGKIKLSEEEVKEESSDEELVHHKAMQGTQELEKTGQTDSAEEPHFHMEKPEELLEDENALSAKQSKEKNTGLPDRKVDVNLKAPERAILGGNNPDPQIEKNKEETGMILERESEAVAKEIDTIDREPTNMAVEKEESTLVDKKTHEVSDLPDKENIHTPELGEVFQNKNSEYLEKDNQVEHLKTSGLTEKPGVEELSKEDHEDTQKFMDKESQRSNFKELEDDQFHWTPPVTVKPEHGEIVEGLPIIGSFFKEQQSFQQFQKYFDVRELEAMFQEMSFKLKSAQQESLPYNVEKVLHKVVFDSGSQIMSVAEKMLSTHVSENKDLGVKENNILEEAAVLRDVQYLISFVRYRHSQLGETLPLATAQPPDERWDGPVKEIEPPHEDNFPPENTDDLKMQVPSHYPVTSDTGVSQMSETLNTEKDLDPGKITTEGIPVDVKKQTETNAEEPTSITPLENAVLLIYSFMFYLSKMLIATLPDDVRPGPDFYGLPWKPVLITAFLGIVSFAIIFWRTVLVVKNRVYQVTEQQISEKMKNIVKENAELKQKLSDYEQKVKESKNHVQETKKQNIILSDEAVKFKDKIKKLEETNGILDGTAKNLHIMLESEREQNAKNQDLILEDKKSIEKLKEVISVNASEFSEVQIALSEAKLSEEKVKSEYHRIQEENGRLKKKKKQLQQEIEDWSKSHAELSEQIKSFQESQKDLEGALMHQDDNIDALTNCITQLNNLECEYESEVKNKGGSGLDELANGEVGGDRSKKMKNQVKQMMDVSWTKTAISVVEEDLKLLQVKLRASMSTKCNLEDEIKKLEDDRDLLQSVKAGLEDECKTLRQKVEILNELYQQKEMALQKKLSQEEYERQEREQQLSAADEKALLAAEEVKTYKRRIEEMEDELRKTERSFKDQIAIHEKKAHDNWLKARAAERALAEEKREATNLRHKLLEVTQKMAKLQEEPVIVKPMAGRPNAQNPPRRGPRSQNGSFGPSPVSGGECSPPLTVDPPGRPLSATLNQREMPRGEFGSVDGPLPRSRSSSEAFGKPSTSDPGSGGTAPVMSTSRSSSPAKVMDEGKQTVPQEPEGPSVPSITSLDDHPVAVNMVAKGHAPFPGVPFMRSPMGAPLPPPPPPPIRYGPPAQLCGPFGPRPLPPPFGPGLRPPLGLREYAPGVPLGKRDLPFDPREFLPGYTPFRPLGSLGPREYFIPGTQLPPPPTHGPQDYPPSPAARDLPISGSRDEPPPTSQSSSQDSSQALKQGP